ncbi:hypothetical protein ACIGBH_33635 [Streptomyces sp. NPDC085929]|uniref:hypothetical protein n=1 Tax=Streptomyces sp. NPDC085929 TaxID=3365739 RepID=UPI0037D936A8
MSKRENISSNYHSTLRGIRENKKLSEQGKKMAAAQAYTAAKAAMAKANAERQADQSQRWDQLERKVWGENLPFGATEADRAANNMAMRDALQRASQLKTQGDAARLLRQAEQTGDATLARAVAQHANEKDWSDVLETYFESRPGKRDAYNEMCDIHRERTSGRPYDSITHAIARPAELRGMHDQAIEAVATEASHLAAG